MDILPQKRCTKCGETKPLSEFPKRKGSPDGYRNYCMPCYRATRYNPAPPAPIPSGVKTCSTCHTTKPVEQFYRSNVNRSGFNSQCKDCNHNVANAWKARNKERIREYEEKNRDHLRELRYAWQIRNRERHLANRRKHYRTPKARLYGLLRSHQRRVAKNGTVTPDQVNALRARQRICYYCKKPFNANRTSTIDHVIPLNKGGLHDISNLVLACKHCNSSKSDSMIRLI